MRKVSTNQLISMAAPRRKATPVSVKATPSGPALSGGVVAGSAPETGSITMVRPNAKMSKDDMFLMKLTQIVMMSIGFLSIWGGVFEVAFDEEATNQNFLVLFVGGLASFAVSIVLIELQSKKNGYRLHDIHNYFLGIAFFFSTVGTLWGTRFLMGYATGTMELDWFGEPGAYTETDWSPNANGIYAQTITCLLLTFGHYMLLRRYSGDTSFGWGVATYAPMAVLLAGVGPWIRWSNGVVSWELGLAIVLISFVSMEMALRSNRALNFVVVAVAAGVVPIIYEMLNDNAPVDGAGGALSLMVFIIAMQGYYAARPDLRKEVMERASVVLIGMVVVAIALARTAPEFNLILGPFRASDYPELAAYINIPVALWVTVLLAYFPAVLQQRVPWMPIGLAVALMAIPQEASTLPWVLSMIVIPYMVFISKIARSWVINITLLAFSASYLLSDWIGIEEGLSAQATYGGTWLHVIIPIFLVAVSEFGRRQKRIETSTSLAMLAAVILSRAVLDPEWFLPWLLIAYMCTMNFSMMASIKTPSLKERKDLTLALAFTSVTILLLALLDNLKLPPADTFDGLVDMGFRPQFLVLSVAMYVLAARAAKLELDAGSIYAWLGQGGEGEMTYNAKTNTWELKSVDLVDNEARILDAALTPLARFSLLTSLMLFTFTVSGVNTGAWSDQPYLVLLMALPVAMLIREVLAMESISSATRASAVTLLVFIAAPLSLSLGPEVWGSEEGINTTTLLLDLILVSAPLIANFAIARRGLDKDGLSRASDAVTYGMLILLGMMDTSGGVLFLPLLALVTWRTLQYRFYWFLALLPIVYVFMGDGWFTHGVFWELLSAAPESIFDYLTDYHSGPYPAFVGLIVAVQMSLGLSGVLTHQSEEAESTLVLLAMGVWLIFGLFSAIPDGYWAPTLGCLFLIPYFWYTDNSKVLPYMLGALFISLYIGFALSSTFQPITDADAWGWSGVLTGFVGTTMAVMHHYGTLFRTPPETEDEIKMADSTAALATQISALAFVAGYSVFFGIGPIIGLILLGRSGLQEGRPNSMIALPILLTFSVVNMMAQAEIGSDEQRQTMTGLTLAVQGIFLTLLSAKDDLIYDYESFEWDTDAAFFAYMDRLGISGVLYSIIGLFIMFDSLNLESMAYLLTTVYLVILGIQGFSEEADARWRRGVGGYGSILTAFLFANSLESDLFSAIATVMSGMVALGFGFLFMQRMNEDDGIYEETVPVAQARLPGGGDAPKPVAKAPVQAAAVEAPVVESTPEEALLDDVMDLEDEDDVLDLEDEEEEELVDATPVEEPAEATVAEVAEEEELVEVTCPHCNGAFGLDEGEVGDFICPHCEGFLAWDGTTAEKILEDIEPEGHSGLLDTGEGFALRLPKDAVDNILASLDSTPHDGYVPVVAFGPNGQIMLTFESDKSGA